MIDIEQLLADDPVEPHEHRADDHSRVKWNGGNPVFLCGYDGPDGCAVIVCYAERDDTGGWRPGRPFP